LAQSHGELEAYACWQTIAWTRAMGTAAHDFAQAKGFIAPPGYRRHFPEATLLYERSSQSR
jgi:hypothetical protein